MSGDDLNRLASLVIRMREAMRAVAYAVEADPDDPEWSEAVGEFHAAMRAAFVPLRATQEASE
jgi:hypothetical protein